MSRDEDNYVALFIDWDNLAISTAVDFAGAVPDVRAIVRAAQRSGTVLIARAYAEWNVSSDRLSVYRAGVEPVYAPTFRFEPEPGSAMPRGKSLADPCLVTDCIDLMHLMPEINVFVLVSGDKDLIPIVRIAQLRGRRVVVIGPDFVAAILREMADEYIPYRALVDSADGNGVAEVGTHQGRGTRRMNGGSSRQTSLPSPSVQRAAPIPPRPVTPQATPSPTLRSPLPDANGNGTADVATPNAVVESPIEMVPVDEQLDPQPLWDMISTIVRDRETAGKPPLRATNLKDQLLARISGFNERKYGFARFKDLLAVAEKSGVIAVSRNGPVQWVSPPSKTSGGSAVVASTPAPSPIVAEPTAVAAPSDVADATDETDTAPLAGDDLDASVVRFIIDLRDRSRWLTYTYLLTNLLNHLGKGSADSAADAAARSTLNRLVQAGVLVVDREPREIDVNGTRHRVRLCHIVESHPLVASILAQMAVTSPDADGEPESAETAATDEVIGEATGVEDSPVGETHSDTGRVEESERAEDADARSGETVDAVEPPAGAEPEPAAPHPDVPTRGAELPSRAEMLAPQPAQAVEPAAAAGEEVVEAPAGDSLENNGSGAAPPTPLTLTESYAVLRDVVREATGPNRPSTGPAAVKNRLVRRLGTFDEHSFGFSKFKDYLLSAERAGIVRVEVTGSTARVSLPPD